VRITASEARRILDSSQAGEVFKDHPLYSWMERLLLQHPRHEEKKALGVAGYAIIKHRRGGVITLVLRPDGCRESFSWKKCVGQITPRMEALQAYREAVEDQVQPLRKPGMHVDHADPWPFQRIVESFEQDHGVARYEEIEHIQDLPDKAAFSSARCRFSGARRSMFADFHRARAVLVTITAQENLSKNRARLGYWSKVKKEMAK